MKKFIQLSLGLILAVVFLGSCEDSFMYVIRGEGDIVSQTLNVTDFEELELAGQFDVEIVYGDEIQVIAVGHANIVERIKTTNYADKLELKLQKGTYRDFELKIYVTTPYIEAVGISGAGDITIGKFVNLDDLDLSISGTGNIVSTDTIIAENIDFEISGSGDIDFTAITHRTSTSISGTGDVKLQGTTFTQEIEISGTGDFNCFKLFSNEIYIDISGSGDCFVYSESLLDAKISGIGDIYYRGYPQINTDISGIGAIHNNN